MNLWVTHEYVQCGLEQREMMYVLDCSLAVGAGGKKHWLYVSNCRFRKEWRMETEPILMITHFSTLRLLGGKIAMRLLWRGEIKKSNIMRNYVIMCDTAMVCDSMEYNTNRIICPPP